jgi:uncharacterized membrane protein YeaQ/YmgE (transglycosylase-associated protein family)
VIVFLVLLLLVVAMLFLGWFFISLTFQLLWLVLVGLVIGALARLVLPGSQPIGWLMTILAGIGGSLGGGLIARAFDVGGFVQLLIAIAVAAALIAFLIAPRRATAH